MSLLRPDVIKQHKPNQTNQSLNWLPIKYRITFKVLLIVYKCVNDLAPKYLSDLFIPYKKDITVRNNFKHLLDCPETVMPKVNRMDTELLALLELICGMHYL